MQHSALVGVAACRSVSVVCTRDYSGWLLCCCVSYVIFVVVCWIAAIRHSFVF